jgi:hypothetical protein
MSRRETTIWTVVLVLLVLSSLVSAIWLVYLAATAIAKIAGVITAAVIALVGTLMSAIINHVNQLDAQRKQEASMAKQDNYKELLSKVGDYARADKSDPKAGEPLSSAHLASWAFGDQKVLESTNKFQNDPNTDTLINLLEAVRDSLGYHEDLPSTEFVRNPDKYDPSVLFPEGAQRMVGLLTGRAKEQERASEEPSGVSFENKEEPRKALEEKVDQQRDQIDQLHDKLDQLLKAGQNEEVENKGNSDESEATNRGHTMSLNDTQSRPSPQVDASKDTEAQELPVSGAQPDTGREEKHEPSSHPRWKFWK